MLIFLEILCVILLSACSSEIYQENRCKLNGKLEYLDTVSLLKLNLPENIDIFLPEEPYDDNYVIPKNSNSSSSINVATNIQKIGKNLDICPPQVLLPSEIEHTSCLINIED